MNVDDRELRSALERFWVAKRALRHAYRRSVVSHGRAQSRPMLEPEAPELAAEHSVMSGELEELKDENQTLRKSLTLLHAHSLRLQDRLDSLLVDRINGAAGGPSAGGAIE